MVNSHYRPYHAAPVVSARANQRESMLGRLTDVKKLESQLIPKEVSITPPWLQTLACA